MCIRDSFSPAELTARIDALYRRAGGGAVEDSGEISQPPFLLNTRNRTLEKNGQRVKLTQVEYSIVKLFMEKPGQALSLIHIWARGERPRGGGSGRAVPFPSCSALPPAQGHGRVRRGGGVGGVACLLYTSR